MKAQANSDSHVETKSHIGTHLIYDFWHCKKEIDDIAFMERALINAAHISSATVLGVLSHKFEPQGVTSMVLLAESHISIHSWPEYDFVAVDVFTCGKQMEPEKAIAYLRDTLKPDRVEKTHLVRGEDYESKG